MSNAALVPRSPENEARTGGCWQRYFAILSQSSGIERPFFTVRRGQVVTNNCALYQLYMLLYKQQRCGFYYCSRRVVTTVKRVIFASCNSSRFSRIGHESRNFVIAPTYAIKTCVAPPTPRGLKMSVLQACCKLVIYLTPRDLFRAK